MTAVLSGLIQPIEQESLPHRKPVSHTIVANRPVHGGSIRKVKTDKADCLRITA